MKHTGAGASSWSLDVRVASDKDRLGQCSSSWTRIPGFWVEGRTSGSRFYLAAASSPLLIRGCFLLLSACCQPRKPRHPPRVSALFLPAAAPRFSRRLRAPFRSRTLLTLLSRPLCLASLCRCILIVGPSPSLLCSRWQTRRAWSAPEPRLRDPFQSRAPTTVVVFTDAVFFSRTNQLHSPVRSSYTDES